MPTCIRFAPLVTLRLAAALTFVALFLAVPSTAFAVCGNGIVDCDENCDDGNTIAGDGCNQYCRIEYGFVCPTIPDPFSFAPIAFWGLDETTAGPAVEEVRSNNGIYVGPTPGAPGAEPGQTKSAADFDGVDDYVEIPHSADYQLAQGSTALWFRPDTLPASPVKAGLFTKDATDLGDGGHLSVWIDPEQGGAIVFRLQMPSNGLLDDGNPCTLATECAGGACVFDADAGADICDGATNFAIGPVPSVGAWHHLVITWGLSGMNLYVNGALAANNPFTGGTLGNSEPIALGADSHRSNAGTVTPIAGFFDGKIDDVYIFDYQLSGADVSTFYGTNTCSVPGGPCTPGAPVTCGDGILDETYEQCDDGNLVAGDGCDELCMNEYCGDGKINDSIEVCDDGNKMLRDGCDGTCQVETGWSCTGEPSVCVPTWTCGNGIVEPGEVCDDPVTCSDDCMRMRTCGDGVLDPGEACDDYNLIDGDGCNSSCAVEPGWTCTEEVVSPQTLPSKCVTTCGDGIRVGWEECDDGNIVAGDGCDEHCMIERCGDGFVKAGEQCDDGNTTAGDGCSSTCQQEAGFVCPPGNQPGRCVPETTCDPDSYRVRTDLGYDHNDPQNCPWDETLDANGDGVLDCADAQHIGVYRDIPAFDVVAGETTIAFDTISVSPNAISATIEMAVATSNGSSQPGPFTTVATMQTGSGLGDTVLRNFDLVFQTDANFSFPGGGLIIRITPHSGTARTFHMHDGTVQVESYVDFDGAYPWDRVLHSWSDGIPVIIQKGAAVCTVNRYGQCSATTLTCVPPAQTYPQTAEWCGNNGGTGANCRDTHSGFYWSRTTQNQGGGDYCSQDRLYKRNPYCNTGSDPRTGYCSSWGSSEALRFERFCENCQDEDPCTNFWYFSSSSGCRYREVAPTSCWDLDPSKRNVGQCSDGRDYCRNPGAECIGQTFPSSELCDAVDNDCNSVIDDPLVTDPLCDDADPLTSDTCNMGVCENVQLCLGTDASCGTVVPCEDCTASTGWTATGVSGPCCDGLSSCICDEYEYRTYYCGGATCEYILEPVSPVYEIVVGTCSSCDDTNVCTNDACNVATGLCENVDSGYSGACYYGPAGTEGIGVCAAGTESCTGTDLGTCDDVQPTVELCNNLDDDCNGYVDDGTANDSCPVGEGCWSGQCDTECTSLAECDPATEFCYFENGTVQVDRITCPADPGTIPGPGHTYELTINGALVSITDDGTPTTAEVCVLLADAINATDEPVTATSDGASVEVAGLNEFSFTITGVDPNLTHTNEEMAVANTPGRCAPISGACDDVMCPGSSTCYEGSCTSTNCGNDLDCNVYSSCYNSGRCLRNDDERCNGVQCPQGEACVKGSCKRACNQNADCSSGNRCLDGYCFPDVDPCDGVDCQVDQICWQNNCFEQCSTDDDCLEPGDVCYDAMRCGPASDPCEGVSCPLGDLCYQGSCYPICDSTPDCSDPAHLCYDADRCAINACDGVQCPTGEACQGGVCYLVCTTDVDCQAISPLHACWGGFCMTGPCDGVQCGTDQVCSGGACYYTCVSDADCAMYDPGHACYEGLCTDDPCADVLCRVDQTCWGGSCYDICASSPDCDPSVPVCWADDRCSTDDPCDGVACASSEVCYQGACYEDCSITMTCTDPQHICWEQSRCAPGPCSDVQCPSGEFCYGGTCYQQCTMDADCSDPMHACYDGRCATSACDGVQCAPGEVCWEGTCYQSCNGSIDCTDPSHICYNNLCLDPCDLTTCGGGETCYLGTCYEYCDSDADCSDPNSICYDNRCVDAEDPWCDGVMCPSGESCYRGTCYEYCDSDADCSDPTSICYDNTCVPTDCSRALCDAGEICYNGVCYEDCSDGVCEDPSHICYDNMRCAASACEAMAQNVIDAYNTDHIFHQAGRRLHGVQLSKLPWLWPRPYSDPGVPFTDWADVPTGSGASSNNDALYALNAARVSLYFDDTDGTYILYLLHGSKNVAQGAASATYSVRIRSANPEVVLMDDHDAEAYSVTDETDGWRHVQAHVTTRASETGGIAIGRFRANHPAWRIEIAANFSGGIDRWELMNGENGRPLAELSASETLSIRTSPLAGTREIQPEFGTVCNTEVPGSCRRGTATECVNHQLVCDQTVFPWTFEICDGVDNTCNGLVDATDSSLQFAIAETRQGTQGWRPWPTVDRVGDVGSWLNYVPADASDDRVGSTHARREDGTALQSADKIFFAMHVDRRNGAFSMPVMVGAQTSSATEITSVSGQDDATWTMAGVGGTGIEEAYVCWYDDRAPASTNDEVLASWDPTSERAVWTNHLDLESGTLESDTVAIRPQWLEGVTGRRTEISVQRSPEEDNVRGYRRYAPALNDLPLHPRIALHVRIGAADPDVAYCVSDSSTLAGCFIGTYMCTPEGIECGPPDDENCRAGCQDADGDGHILYDPVFCVDGTDCDDFDPETYPGALEQCNGRDNDCDGQIDLQTTGTCGNGQASCGPDDCGGLPVCVCPNGVVEFYGDPADVCFCGEGLAP